LEIKKERKIRFDTFTWNSLDLAFICCSIKEKVTLEEKYNYKKHYQMLGQIDIFLDTSWMKIYPITKYL
jgi:hypothetical protein